MIIVQIIIKYRWEVMDLYSKEIYTLVIPIKPEKDQPNGYYPGPCVGSYEAHKEFLDDKGKVFWSWHLTNTGIKKKIKETFPDLTQKLGTFQEINGKMVKVNDYGFFYSSEDKSLKWKFRASAIKTGYIGKEESDCKYIPDFRKVHNRRDSKITWLLIEELEELDEPVKGERTLNSNAYEFSDLCFYSNKTHTKEIFNTNHLTGGNAFLIEECF